MSDINNVQVGGAAYNEAGNTVQTVKAQRVSEAKKNVSATGVEEEKGKEAVQNGFNKSTVRNAINMANDSLKENRTSAKFKYHEATKQVSIKIVDDETQEVIKEIPPEKSIEMLEKMLELSGILVDEKR